MKITKAKPRSPRYLSEQERIQIADLWAAERGVASIARQLGRAPSMISREIRRNRDSDGRYRPHHAEQAARQRAGQPRQRRIAVDEVLAEVVQRLLSKRWSPEQVAHELRVRFADQRSRWLCKETIYQAIYDTADSLTRPARRRRRRRRLQGLQRRGRLTAMRMIDERPTRYLVLLAFPDGIATTDRVRQAITNALASVPPGLRRTLTWDQGKELAQHQQISAATGPFMFSLLPRCHGECASQKRHVGAARPVSPVLAVNHEGIDDGEPSRRRRR